MASLKKRPDGVWRARFRDPDGKEHAHHADTKAAAQAWLDRQTASLVRGDYVDPKAGKTTLREYADTWLARMRPSWRAATDAAVSNSFDKHVLPMLGSRPLVNIRRADVEALCASLPLAPSTVGIVHQHLGQLLGAAVEDGLIARNPAVRARLPRREPRRAQPVPLEVIERIHGALPDWMKVAVPLGAGVGLRQGEASGLSVDRVDFLRRNLRVDRQLVDRNLDEPVLTPPKTDSSNRTVPLADFVVEALSGHLARFQRHPDQLVLLDPDGLPVASGRFGHQWRQAVKKAGASTGLRFHDLRHTFASTLLSRGVSVKAVADWLGHASPAITLSTYAHVMPTDESVARTVLDAALSADFSRTEAGDGERDAL
jgi:integrase